VIAVRRVWNLMWKEVVELRQDPRTFPLVFVAPLIQLTLLGYAATTDVNNVPAVVVDADRSVASRELITRFEGSPYFSIVGVVESTDRIDPYLLSGDAWLALTIPAGYGAAIHRGEPAVVQVVADGSDANSSNLAIGYARGLVAGYAEELVLARAPSSARGGQLRPDVRVWFNPQLESRVFMVPGVFALVLLVITTMLTSMAIVREKEIGTLEQLNVTPLARWELIAGKLAPYAVIGMIDILLVVAVAIFWFEVPARGSIPLLFGLSLVYVLNTLALGLLVSTVSNTQQQAMMTAAFFVMMPMIYLSGFIFPIENMPAVIQPVTYLVPVRYYLVIVRGILLKGVGVEVLWPQGAALLGLGAAILAFAVMRSRKTVG
jgi:ABC-2 type transport system permease protein